MGLFKKPNRKFRQRVTHADSDDEETRDEQTEGKERKPKEQKNIIVLESRNDKLPSTSSVSNAKDVPSKDEKNDGQSGIVPASKLLSFLDEDDEAEVFKLKKSNYSRRLAKQLEKERKKRGEYVSSATASSSKGFQPSKFEIKADESDAKLHKQESGNIFSGKEAEDMDVDDEDEDKPVKKENPFKDVLQSGRIPDAATIYAMKKHRQMAREMGDYIPLEDPDKDEEKSQMARDDDNIHSDDDDDEPTRISFAVNTAAAERQKVREAFLSLQEAPSQELEIEDAAELDRWEQEQIRKGVSLIAQTVPPKTTSDNFYSYIPSVPEDNSYYAVQQATIESLDNISQSSMPINFKESSKDQLTTQIIKARLEERLASLKLLHASHEQELESCKKEMEEANDLVEKLEKEAPVLSKRFSLYQQMSGYVRDLVECLDMKVAHIEVLDKQLMDLYKTRVKYLTSRRQLDVRDQSDEYSLLLSKVLKGTSIDGVGDKNGCLDESKLRRAAEREGRRMRRRKQRERSQLISKHQDGMSTDDEELDIEVMKFRETRENILLESREIFEDVVEDFGTIDGVMTNFGKWKNEQGESYVEAFAPLCLPKIFGPFVRIEMFGWNPLEEDLEIESTFWYKSLIFYEQSSVMEEDEDNSDDPDINLIPVIVEKVLVAKMTTFIKDVYDPLSSQQTNNLVSIMSKFHEEYPSVSGSSKTIQTLLQAVVDRISKSLEEDIFIPLYPKELLENRSSGSSIFFQRQFWSTVKLLNNILCWDGILAEKPLQDMALSSLLNRYLLMGLNTSMIMKDTLDKCKAIVSSFPKSWFAAVRGSTTLPQLRQFSQYLVKYAQSLQSSVPKRILVDDEEDIRETVKEIVQLLISIGALDEAVVLAKHFSISGFKKDK